MVEKIKKRDGHIVDFDKLKILNAIAKANLAVGKEMTDTDILFVTDKVCERIDENNNTVEQIQDIVEETLIQYNFKKAAKEYIIYRENHAKIRNNESFLMDIYKRITYSDAKDEDIKRENANINAEAAMGAMLKYGSEGSKYFLYNYVLPKDISLAHNRGDIHIHDADFYMLTETCCQIDLDKLFEKGFYTGHGFIRPPQSIESYASLTCIVIQSNQNEMHGGQAIPSLDYMLAPGITKTYKKELINTCVNYISIASEEITNEENIKDSIIKMFDNFDFKLPKEDYILDEEVNRILETIEDLPNCIDSHKLSKMLNYAIPKAISITGNRTHQAMESLIHNLGTMNSRGGGQVPFSSINYGLDTSPEGRMVIKNVLRATEEGLGLGETPIFPVQIFKLKKGINLNKEDPNYDLFRYSMKVSTKRLFPNYLNIDSSFNLPYYRKDDHNTHVAAMGAVSSGYVKLYIPDCHIKYSTVDISKVYDFLRERGLCSKIEQFDEHTWFTYVKEDVYIMDSLAGTYVPLKKWMKFRDPNTKWYRLTLRHPNPSSDEYYTNLFTHDHPLPVRDCRFHINPPEEIVTDRVKVEDLSLNDILLMTDGCTGELKRFFVKSIEQVNEVCDGYDVETGSDKFDIYIDHPNKECSLIGLCSHNCRTRVMGNVYDPSREVTNSRGNLSFTTINLPRIGILADKDINKFFSLLDEKIDLCFRQLLHRLGIQKKRKAKNYPFLMLNGIWIDSDKLDPEDEVGDILNHGTLSIGYIGLAETLISLIGKHHGESEEAQELGLNIVKHMRQRCDEKSQEMKLNFTLLATPAESLCSRFAELNRKEFGVIPGVTDREYITNSNHVPVYFNISAYKKIKIEAPYHKYCNAGNILYIEQNGDLSKNIDVFESLINYMVEQDAGYFAVNHPVDRDPVCGYVGVINDVCPRCGRKEGEGITLEKYNELKKKYRNVPPLKIEA